MHSYVISNCKGCRKGAGLSSIWMLVTLTQPIASLPHDKGECFPASSKIKKYKFRQLSNFSKNKICRILRKFRIAIYTSCCVHHHTRRMATRTLTLRVKQGETDSVHNVEVQPSTTVLEMKQQVRTTPPQLASQSHHIEQIHQRHYIQFN